MSVRHNDDVVRFQRFFVVRLRYSFGGFGIAVAGPCDEVIDNLFHVVILRLVFPIHTFSAQSDV